MGWSGPSPNAEGRMVGYAVSATCDQPDCEVDIDRGLAYCCGGMHDGGEWGCGYYFCPDHLYFASVPEDDDTEGFTQVCGACSKLIDDDYTCANCGEFTNTVSYSGCKHCRDDDE